MDEGTGASRCLATAGCLDGEAFLPECEVLYEGGQGCQTLYDRCTKNPGHRTFIPVNEFKMDDLPLEIRTETVKKYIEDCCDKTVKINVCYTSPNRPDAFPRSSNPYPFSELKGNPATRCGTGFINHVLPLDLHQGRSSCPCHICRCQTITRNTQQSEKDIIITEYRLVSVETAAHVIYDNLEAERSVFELFYDSEESNDDDEVKKKKILYGVEVLGGDDEIKRRRRCHDDVIQISCATHDPELIKILSGMNFSMTSLDGSRHLVKPFGVIPSHPHGRSKRITIGQCLDWTVPVLSSRERDFPLKLKLKPYFDTNVDFVKCRLPQIGTTEREIIVTSTVTPTNTMKGDECMHFKANDSFVLNPGIVHTFEDEITVKFPTNTKFLLQLKARSSPWVTFPPQTIIFIRGGTCWFPAGDLEFNYAHMASDLPASWFLPVYRRYDIDTCPGSSGAPVLCAERFNMYSICHAGVIGKGINRSAIREY